MLFPVGRFPARACTLRSSAESRGVWRRWRPKPEEKVLLCLLCFAMLNLNWRWRLFQDCFYRPLKNDFLAAGFSSPRTLFWSVRTQVSHAPAPSISDAMKHSSFIQSCLECGELGRESLVCVTRMAWHGMSCLVLSCCVQTNSNCKDPFVKKKKEIDTSCFATNHYFRRTEEIHVAVRWKNIVYCQERLN